MVNKFCISTINRHRFDPVEPTYDDIELDDIAHALSMMTRANGHFKEFYSVARHSINCLYEARLRGYSYKVQLLCLLHDSAEAYIGDMTRPLKLRLPQFSLYEKNLQKIIYLKYATTDVSSEEKEQVKSVDDSLLYHEFLYYHGDKLLNFTPRIQIDVAENSKGIAETKEEFLSLYEKTVKLWKAQAGIHGTDAEK